MIMVKSLLQAYQYVSSTKPKNKYILISINDTVDYGIPHKDDEKLVDWMEIYFKDIGKELPGHSITMDHAKAIVCFVKKHKYQYDILIHCYAGISRSAAVAAAIEEDMTRQQSTIHNDASYDPNMLVYDYVKKAFEEYNEGGNRNAKNHSN